MTGILVFVEAFLSRAHLNRVKQRLALTHTDLHTVSKGLAAMSAPASPASAGIDLAEAKRAYSKMDRAEINQIRANGRPRVGTPTVCGSRTFIFRNVSIFRAQVKGRLHLERWGRPDCTCLSHTPPEERDSKHLKPEQLAIWTATKGNHKKRQRLRDLFLERGGYHVAQTRRCE